MNIKLNKSDIYLLCRDVFEKDGFVVCRIDKDNPVPGVTLILLREVLSLFGKGIGIYEMIEGENPDGVRIVDEMTNLSWEKFQKAINLEFKRNK